MTRREQAQELFNSKRNSWVGVEDVTTLLLQVEREVWEKVIAKLDSRATAFVHLGLTLNGPQLLAIVGLIDWAQEQANKLKEPPCEDRR